MISPQMLVTIDEVRMWCRIDEQEMDLNLQMAITGASASVLRYLKRTEPFPEGEVPEDVRLATALFAGIMIRDPDGVDSSQWDAGYIPRPVLSLLYPYRDPTAA